MASVKTEDLFVKKKKEDEKKKSPQQMVNDTAKAFSERLSDGYAAYKNKSGGGGPSTASGYQSKTDFGALVQPIKWDKLIGEQRIEADPLNDGFFLSTDGWHEAAEVKKAERERDRIVQEYVDTTVKNRTYMPNSHVEEFNENLMEQGLHPIYTNSSWAKPFDAVEKYNAQIRVMGRESDRLRAENEDEEKNREYEHNKMELADLQMEYDDSLQPGHPNYEENKRKGERIQELIRLIDGYELKRAENEKRIEYLDGQLRISEENAAVAGMPQEVQDLLYKIAKADDEFSGYAVRDFFSGFGKGASGTGFSTSDNIRDTAIADSKQEEYAARQALKDMGYSEDQIESMYQAYKNVLNDRLAAEGKKDIQAAAEKLPILTSILSVPAGLVGGLVGSVGAIVHPGERNNPIFTGISQFSSTAQDTVRTNIEKNVRSKIKDPSAANFFSKAAGFGYSAATAALQSAMAMGLGSVVGVPMLGEAILGAGAASQQYNDMLNKGFSYEDALWGGAISGAIETLTEHVSLENLRFLKATHGGLKNLPLNVVKSFITEGSEEIASDVLNEAFDYFAHGGLSTYYTFVTNYLEEHKGATEDEARAAYAKDFGWQLFESGIIGGLSGAMGAGRVGGMQVAANAFQNYDVGRGVRNTSEYAGIRESDVVAGIRNELEDGSRAQGRMDRMFGAPNAQAETEAQTGEELTKAAPEGAAVSDQSEGATKTERDRTFIERMKEAIRNAPSDYRKGRAVNKAIEALSAQSRTEIETRLMRDYGYGKRNAVSTSYAIVDLLNGVTAEKDAGDLLNKKGVKEIVNSVLYNLKDDENRRYYAVNNLMQALNIAKGEGSAAEKNERLKALEEVTGIKREVLMQVYSDEQVQEIRKAAKEGKPVKAPTVSASMEIDGKSHDVKLSKVVGIEDGDLIFETERDGETVKLSDVDLTAYKGGDEAQEVYEQIGRYMSGEGYSVKMSADGANTLLAIWEQQPAGVDVLEDGYKAYAAGKSGMSMHSLETTYSRTKRAMRADTREAVDENAYRASTTVMLAMWEAGVRERELKTGGVRVGVNDVTEKQVDEMYVVSEVFKDYGRGVVFVDELYSTRKSDIPDLAGSLQEGRVMVPLSAYNAYTGKTQDNVLLLSAQHETVHRIKLQNRTMYDGMRDMAVRKLKQQKGEDGYRAIYDQRAKAYEGETWALRGDEIRDFVEEEITAQYFGAMFQRAFCEEEVRKNPGLWQKVKDVFKKIVNDIKRKLEMLAKKDLVVEAAMEADFRDVQEAYSIFDSVLRYVQQHGEETENKKAAEEAGRLSKILGSEEYKKPITRNDLQELRSLFPTRKSINDFSEEELKATEKWAYKYYQQMGTKSPFFRAWFGDWRLHDTNPVSVIDIPAIDESDFRKFLTEQRSLDGIENLDTKNNANETGWEIKVTSQGEFNTRRHSGKEKLSYAAMTGIRGLIRNGILLDTEIHEHHADGAKTAENDPVAFDHRLYALGKTKTGINLYRITIEDRFHDPKHTNEMWFHNLKHIEKVAENITGRHFGEDQKRDVSNSDESVTAYTVADLYHFVKKFDNEFNVGREISSIVLSDDGTPKVFYHGTDEDFTAFDITKSRSWDGAPDYDLPGFYFSESPEISGDYGEGVHAYYLTAEKIWRTSKNGDLKSLQKKYGTYRAAYDELIRQGYDCVYVDDPGVAEDERDYIILKPENIKSAETGTDRANIGTFSRYSDDTKFSRVLGASEIENAAVEHFGTTEDYRVAGYVLRDGRMLDFSGAHWLEGESPAYIATWREKNDIRQVDHEDIFEAYEQSGGDFPSDSALDFMKKGNIRIVPEAPGIEVYSDAEPTAEQYARIRDYIRTATAETKRFPVGKFTVDITKSRKARVGSIHYTGNINAERIVNDLKHYFATGEIREQSDVDRFRFSRILGAEAAEYAERVKVGNPLNRAQIDLLQETAEDMGAFDEGELSVQQSVSLARKYNLSGNETQVKEIARRLREIREGMQGSENVDSALYALYEIAKEEAAGAGDWMDTDDGTVRDFKKWIRGQSIYVSEEDLNEIAENYGGRAALRRVTFGKFNLTTNKEKGKAGGLDAFWDELLEQHFGFTETTDNSDRVRQLLDMWGRGDKVWVYDSDAINAGETLEETANDYAVKMLRDLLYAGRKPTKTERERLQRLDVLSDELKKQRDAGIRDADKSLETEYRQKLEDLQNSDRDLMEVEREAQELREARRIDAIRKAYEARIETLERNQRENVERQGLLRDIHRNMSSLGKLVVNAKDTDHVPEELKNSVLHFVRAFSNGDRNVFTPAMARDLSHAYAAIAAETLDDGSMNPLYRGFDEDIQEAIRTLTDKITRVENSEGQQIKTGLLDLNELRQVATITEHILAVVRQANTMFVDGKRQKVEDFGKRLITETAEKKRNAVQNKFAENRAYTFLTGDMLTPIYFFKEKLGGTFGDLYEDFRNAQDQWYRRCEAGRDAIGKAKEDFHYKKWKDEKHHFYFTNAGTGANGKVFDRDLTVDEMLQIYATYRRETENGMESAHLTHGIVLAKSVETWAERVHRWFNRNRGEKSESGKNANRQKTNGMLEEVKRRAENEKFELSVEQLNEIIGALTDEQKAYADAVVKFMSSDVSDWGNEASMELYGYKKFLEKYYFPYQSAENYLYQKLGTTNDARLKSAGFSKKLVHGAGTPLVISGFTEIAANHIQEMAMYASFLNPIENFTRVYNFNDKESGQSVKSELGAVYGTSVAQYIDGFITAVNGGMRSDRIDNIWNRGTSLFKKAAVMANASVVIQQPTALLRAMALINPRFFGGLTSPGTFVLRGADYRDMMEHSEIAGIKQMGGFDTGMGQNAVDWILDEKSVGQRLSDWAGKGAEWADAVTWTNIWNAVRRETKAKHKDVEVGSEAFYEICRKRFRDICDYTQVYDSTLSKSALMNSKSALTKMVTAFMAEPTLSFNLLTQSGKGRTIHKGRALIAFVANVIVNAAFQAIVGAWRKKDEDETYLESWAETFAGNLFGSKDVGFLDSALSPVTMIPWVKDLLSIAEGYDVERSDVSVFSDLIGAVMDVVGMIRDRKAPTREDLIELAGVLSAFGPVPIKRALQDVEGIIRTVKGWTNESVRNTVETVRDAFLAGLGFDKSKAENAYDAVKTGNTEEIRRLLTPDEEKIKAYEEQGYSHEDAVQKATAEAESRFQTQVKQGLIEKDPRVTEAAESRLTGDYDNYQLLIDQMTADGFDLRTVVAAVKTLTDKLRKEAEEPEYEEKPDAPIKYYEKADFTAAVERGDLDGVSRLWDALEDQGTKTDTIRGYLKPYYLDAFEAGDEKTAEKYRTLMLEKGTKETTLNEMAKDWAEMYYEESGMDRTKTAKILTGFAGMDEAAADLQIEHWTYKIGHPDGSLTKEQLGKYKTDAEPLGISVEIYEQYDALMKAAKGTDLDGDGKTDSGSLKAEKMKRIDSLPISKAQKDGLYRLNGWAESTIKDAPWRK